MASVPFKKFLSTPVEKLFPTDSAWPPLACFSLLTLSNASLSYGNLPFSWKIPVVLLGLFFPLAVVYSLLKARPSPIDREAFPLSIGLWLPLLAAAFFFRFYKLTSLSTWPVMDEGLSGYFAIRLYEHWNWELLHWVSQAPTLYNWGLAFCFKLLGPSLFSLWLFPAVCSLLCLPLAWWAFKSFASRSGRFLFLAFLALGFWPLYMGRFSVQSILVVFWELLTFGLLAAYIGEKQWNGRLRRVAGLGIALGVGFYTYLAWPMVALLTGFVLLTDRTITLPRRLRATGLCSLIAAVLALPLLLAYSHEYRGYFGHLGPSGMISDWQGRLSLSWSYFRDLFWGDPGGFFRYGPLWGGLFDPVLTSFLLWGAAQLAAKPSSLTLWMPVGAFLFFLPALLTNNLELMRLTPLLPLLVAVMAIGAQSLLIHLPSGRILSLAAILAVVGCLDANHLFRVYVRHWEKNPAYYGAHKSPEFYRAYSLLKPLMNKEGPGVILLNFNPDPFDQTLFIATYQFNAAENPDLDPAKAQWGALLANSHEQPYLAGLFPSGRWVWLSKGLNRPDGGFLLGWVRFDLSNRGIWEKWSKADRSLKELNHMVMERDVDPNQGPMLEALQEVYPSFKGDLFLESRYWRIMALHHAAGGDIAGAISDEQKAIGRGLPLAPLYNELGCLLFKEKDMAGARKAFKQALQARPDLTNAAENLRNLQTISGVKP